jgi:hypothetical protein
VPAEAPGPARPAARVDRGALAPPTSYYFDDVLVDEVLETPGITVTEMHGSLYLGLSREPEGTPGVVPDLLPLCLTTGLGWRVARPPLAVTAFLGLEWEILEPLHVGDTVHSRSRTVAKRSRREGGVVIEEREVIDQRGTVIQRGRFTYLVARRPDGAGPARPVSPGGGDRDDV